MMSATTIFPVRRETRKPRAYMNSPSPQPGRLNSLTISQPDMIISQMKEDSKLLQLRKLHKVLHRERVLSASCHLVKTRE